MFKGLVSKNPIRDSSTSKSLLFPATFKEVKIGKFQRNKNNRILESNSKGKLKSEKAFQQNWIILSNTLVINNSFVKGTFIN